MKCRPLKRSDRPTNESNRLAAKSLNYKYPKIAKRSESKERDAENIKLLHEGGWEVLVLWQCKLKDMDAVVTRLVDFLEEDRESAY
jgi:DNA mismatch endonuclease, patch repair protein